ELVTKAKAVFDQLSKTRAVVWDDRGNIGKRYLAQDEIGTPYCITIDYQTLEDDTVTLRDRDTTKQERFKLTELEQQLANMLI
ncbi:MAG: glycyl-tRNA synthetase, partial [uncultured bacterium]